MKSKRTAAVVLFFLFTACSGAGRPSMRPSTQDRPAPLVTLIWLGQGKAQRLEDGVWKRVPQFDYEFSVVQRRYADHWESIKEMHRRHPGYDGSAGPRDLTYSFDIRYEPATADGLVTGTIWSTLGDGTITTDREYRKGQLELAAEVSRFAPFNAYRITQDYQYEQGRLTELVELYKKDGSQETPWVKNEEEAHLFGVQAFDAPPTTR